MNEEIKIFTCFGFKEEQKLCPRLLMAIVPQAADGYCAPGC